MRTLQSLALLAVVTGLGGCGYFPVPPDPIHYVNAPTDVAGCRRLGSVGLARTDGVGPYDFGSLTTPVRSDIVAGTRLYPIPAGREIVAPNLALRVEVMRDAALALGGTELLLSRRIYHDWSYVEGIAYRCRR